MGEESKTSVFSLKTIGMYNLDKLVFVKKFLKVSKNLSSGEPNVSFQTKLTLTFC